MTKGYNAPRRWRCASIVAFLLFGLATSARAEDNDEKVPFGSMCGVERWSYKILVDRQGASIAAQTPISTSVDALGRMPVPADPLGLKARFAPLETHVWRVRARLLGYKLEDDSDYHLILIDPKTGAQMIAEIPAAYCAEGSPWQTAFTRARTMIDSLGGGHHASRRWWYLDYRGATPPLIEITAAGFADDAHGQKGLAPNAAELHPVETVRPL